MHKSKTGTLTAGTVRIILKEQLKGLLQVTIDFHLWAQSEGHQHTRNSFAVFVWCTNFGQAIKGTRIFSNIVICWPRKCQYSSKTEDQCSQTMKQAAKETFENNIYHPDTMKTVTKAYSSNRECSVQEAIYDILPLLKPRRIFPAVYFVSTSLP